MQGTCLPCSSPMHYYGAKPVTDWYPQLSSSLQPPNHLQLSGSLSALNIPPPFSSLTISEPVQKLHMQISTDVVQWIKMGSYGDFRAASSPTSWYQMRWSMGIHIKVTETSHLPYTFPTMNGSQFHIKFIRAILCDNVDHPGGNRKSRERSEHRSFWTILREVIKLQRSLVNDAISNDCSRRGEWQVAFGCMWLCAVTPYQGHTITSETRLSWVFYTSGPCLGGAIIISYRRWPHMWFFPCTDVPWSVYFRLDINVQCAEWRDD